MQTHIVNNHFYARLTKLVSKYHHKIITSQKCPFGPQCQTNIQNMANSDLILHLAIDHKLIDKFIQDLAKELKKFGLTFKTQSLKCPFRGKPGVVETAACNKDKTPFQLIQHVFVHCSDEVRIQLINRTRERNWYIMYPMKNPKRHFFGLNMKFSMCGEYIIFFPKSLFPQGRRDNLKLYRFYRLFWKALNF